MSLVSMEFTFNRGLFINILQGIGLWMKLGIPNDPKLFLVRCQLANEDGHLHLVSFCFIMKTKLMLLNKVEIYIWNCSDGETLHWT